MKRIFVDMDNVLCDYKKLHAEKISENPDIVYPQSQYGFFTDLEEIDGAIESYRALENYYDVWILTRPSWKNPLCYTEKRMWIEKHLSFEHCEKLILCCDKSLLKGDYLIDDHKYDFEGESILFGSEEYPDWNSVLKKLI